MQEIPFAQFTNWRELFRSPAATWAIESIVAGNTAGRLWIAEQTLLLWDQGNNVFYLAGAPPSEATGYDLAFLIDEQIRPAAIVEGLRYFKLRVAAPEAAAIIPVILPQIDLREISTLIYRCTGTIVAQPMPDLGGCELVPIDHALLEQSQLRRREEVLDEIDWMWRERADFYRHGFGVAACLPGEIIGWCTAEYVSPGHCGVGVATAAEFQRRGVGSAMAARFLEECRRRDMQVLWEAASSNSASCRLAARVGLVCSDEERTWQGQFPLFSLRLNDSVSAKE
ncbi:MAG: GNAT family N-acetyltransferase [Oscillochloris sp.]|nr:GNAT family N-acetyltransferase [Oscillochloris sp.]